MSEAYRIIWAPVALEDFEGILDYVAERNSPPAAKQLGLRLLTRVERLSRYPSRCRIVPELREIGVLDYRELIDRPYRILFRIAGRHVDVLAVLDGRRDLAELLLNRVLGE